MSHYTLYFSLYVGAFLLSVMGLWFSAIVTGIDRFSKRFFMSYFLIFMLCCLSSIVEAIFQYYIVPKAIYYFMLLLATLLLSLPLPMLTVYLLHCCGESIRSSRFFHAVLGLWTVFFILLVSVPFVGGFGHITPEDQFYRGPLYPLLQIPIISVLLFNVAGTVRRRAHFSRKAFLSSTPKRRGRSRWISQTTCAGISMPSQTMVPFHFPKNWSTPAPIWLWNKRDMTICLSWIGT